MKAIWRTLLDLFDVMPEGSKRFTVWYSIVTGALALLDTVALALIVLTVTPVVTGTPIDLPLIGVMPQSATIWIAVVVCALFILKGVFAVALHRYATRRFARYELEVGNRLFDRYMRSSWEERSKQSTAEVTRLIDVAMMNTNLGFIIPISQVPGNVFTFLAVLAVLVVAEPITALVAFIYLSVVSGLMVFAIAKRTRSAGISNRDLSYRVASVITEMIDALKEVTLRGKIGEVGRVVEKNRSVATLARSDVAFFGALPKYTLKAALIGGFFFVGGAALLFNGPAGAVSAIALFAATGFRMIPALTGIQGAITSSSANEVFARDVITALRAEPEQGTSADPGRDRSRFPEQPKLLVLDDVSFRYPGADRDVLDGLSLTVPFGSSLAIVGPSGAGKSTLIDILLGLSEPTSGHLKVDGHALDDAMLQWQSQVGYVPQRVALFDGTVAQNVALTWEDDYVPERVVEALAKAHLSELATRGDGIDSLIGERGQAISGGQQQRLGIARALYTDPLVLVMDEATSSLDTATEKRITESMQELRGHVTFITVAHRLSTIREYDQVCYLDRGRILGSGTFEEVVAQVPEFRVQAHLAGLIS